MFNVSLFNNVEIILYRGKKKETGARGNDLMSRTGTGCDKKKKYISAHAHS